MSNNQNTRQAQATALDTMIDHHHEMGNVGFCFDTFKGSYSNPLQTFRLMSIDPGTESSVEESALAKLTGLPATAFTDEVLTGVTEAQMLIALGQCALVFLDCVRAGIHAEITQGAKQTENQSDGVLSMWGEVRGASAHVEH